MSRHGHSPKGRRDMIDRRILVDHLPQTPPNLDVRDAALNHFRKSAQRFPKEVRGHLQILVHRLRSFGQFSQIQRTDAMTANQNPKTTAASNTLKGSLRELGLFPKESNVATVKMKATEEPYFQRLLTGADENFRCTLTLPEKIVPTLGLAIGRVLDLEPVLAILTIHSGLALGDNSFEVASADFRKQFLSCALYMLRIQQTGTVAHANEFRETGFPLEKRRPPEIRVQADDFAVENGIGHGSGYGIAALHEFI